MISPMRGRAQQTQRRILDAAYGLFFRKGFTRVSVDEIAAAATVTKRTLYYHFKSKDDLLASVLEMDSELAILRLRKREHRYTGDVSDMLSNLFSDLAKWSATPGWSGAGFTRLVMELADLPGHPARAIARRHKSLLEAWWAGLLQKAGVPLPRGRARELVLLLEGAMVMILTHGDRAYAEAAARAAKQLMSPQQRRRLRKPR